MGSTRLEAQITAKDSASPVFATVGNAAAKMGSAVTTAAKNASTALKENKKAADDLKIGALALGTAFTLASRSALDQTRSIDAVNRLYGESADEILKATEALQDNTNFSNDAARQAAITGATLVSNYALTADQIAVLIERSANLAQVHGIDLADAMSRVSGAIRGEGEAAELLGLNMSDSAVATAAAAAGITNWTTGATEAEKAAFRYSLVLEQTNATLGAAEDAHNTAAGTVRGFANDVGDLAQKFALATGPVGESAAVLSDYALQIGVTIGGVVKLGEGLKSLGAGAKIAQAGSAALSLAMGPAGVVAAAGLATFGIVKLIDALTTDYGEVVDSASSKTKGFAAALEELAAAGNNNAVLGAQWKADYEAQAGAQRDLATAIANTQLELAKLAEASKLPGGLNADQSAQKKALEVKLSQYQSLVALYGDAETAAREFGETEDALANIITHSGPGAERARIEAQKYHDELLAGTKTLPEYDTAIQTLSASLGEYDMQALRSAGAATEAGDAAKKATVDYSALDKAVADLAVSQTASAEQTKLLADIALIGASGTDAMKESVIKLLPQYKAGTDVLGAFTFTVARNADILRDQAAAADAAAEAMAKQTVGYYSNAAGSHAVSDELKEYIAQQKAAKELLASSTPQAIEDAKQLAVQGDRWAALAEGGVWDVSGQLVATKNGLARTKAELDAVAQSARNAAEQLLGTSSFASKIRPIDIGVRGGDKVTGTAADLQKTQSILNSVLGTFKQLDSLGQASEEASSIATNLIGDPGELGIIDGLLKKGRISTDEFNAAVKAGTQIRKEEGAIENDLNTIRAKQLPLLADADRQYGNLIDRISHMTAEQATSTLGFMDATESMKAQNAVAVAAAAAQADVGSAARESAEAIIQGAVAADPVLKQMLLDIGLVTEDKEGNIHVNFDNADSLNKSTDDLTAAILGLTDAIKLIPNANPTITLTGGDSTLETVGLVGEALGKLDGTTANTYINTIKSITDLGTTGSAGGAVTGSTPATGDQRVGGFLTFANGGVVSLAEAGPEMLRFANGGIAMAMNPGLYAVPNQTLVHTAPATKEKMRGGGGNQTFSFTFHGVEGANQVLEAIKIAAREHFAGYR